MSAPQEDMAMLKTAGTGLNTTATRKRRHEHAIAVLAAGGLALALGLSTADEANAQSETTGKVCSEATLRGRYGFTVSGKRAAGPTTIETFIAVGVRTYDGHGGFSDTASFHGEVLPVHRGIGTDLAVSGTYVVNPDCTGTSILYPPGIPPIESDFVIVDHGKSVLGAVMSPAPNVTTERFERQ
jgi:hypothetical protein